MVDCKWFETDIISNDIIDEMVIKMIVTLNGHRMNS